MTGEESVPQPSSRRVPARVTPRVLVVDHHDSYTWNLVHLVAEVAGTVPDVVEHDEVSVDTVLSGGWSHLVLSPGRRRSSWSGRSSRSGSVS